MDDDGTDVVYRHAAGIDISKSDAKICVRHLPVGGRRARSGQPRVFGSTMSQVRSAGRWLVSEGVEHVVMESTSAYWKTWWDGLRDCGFVMTLSNAHMVKQLKGRKTDMSDAAWLAKLAMLDMAPASFVPPAEIQDLRLATRARAKQVRRMTSVTASLEKLLESTGMKLSDVSSKLLTVSGRAILEQVCAGNTDPVVLAGFSRLRNVTGQPLVEALESRIRPVHSRLIRSHLDMIDNLTTQIASLGHEIERLSRPFEHQVWLLDTIPGIDQLLARSIIGEIGVDMSVFPTARRLAAWAGVAPGSYESAGKTRPAGARKGDKHLKVLLSQAAQSAVPVKDSFYRARFHRVRARRGEAKAYTAVAHSIILTIWSILTNDEPYRELGGDYYTRTATTAQRARLQAKAEATLDRLGVDYTINDTD